MESDDERVSVVACNSILNRAYGTPRAAEEPKDDMTARLKGMSRAERLALMHKLLEPMSQYLQPGEDAESTVAVGEVIGGRATGMARLPGSRHSK
jgi:hypothetical protein